MKTLNLTSNKKEKRTISFSTFKNACSNQEYFIWPKLDEQGEILIPRIDKYGFELYPAEQKILAQNYEENQLHHFDFLDEEDDELLDDEDYWERQFELANELTYKQNANVIAINRELKKQQLNFLKSTCFIEDLDKIEVLESAKQNLDLKKINQKAFLDPNIRYIINPSFVSEVNLDNFSNAIKNNYEFFLRSSALAFDKKRKILYFSKISGSTKRIDYLKAFYLFNSALEANYLINYNNHQELFAIKEIVLLIFDKFGENKKNKIDFIATKAANSSKSPISFSVKEKQGCPYIYPEGTLEKNYLKRKISNGTYFFTEHESGLEMTFLKSIYQNHLLKNPKVKWDDKELKAKYEQGSNDNKLDPDFEDSNYPEFSNKISEIIKSILIDKPTYSKNNSFYLPKDSNTIFGDNSIAKQIVNLYLKPEFNFSTSIHRITVVDEQFIKDFKAKVLKRQEIPNFFSNNVFWLISKYLRKNQKIVWYDYESFSSIFPVFDHAKPYKHITNQVSIIVTQNGKTINSLSKNIVLDPKNISLLDLVKNILEIYNDAADAYVVYNKNYENSKNYEVLELVKTYYENNEQEFIEEMKKININSFDQFAQIVCHINTHTLDLQDFFKNTPLHYTSSYEEPYQGEAVFQTKLIDEFDFHKQRSTSNEFDFKKMAANELRTFSNQINPKNASNKINTIYIYELLGFTSIKKIEKLITKNDIDIKKIIPYESLEIKKGNIAMEELIKRNIGITGDSQWKLVEQDLKRYCQNDVEAMIMTFDFVCKMIADVFPKLNKFKYTLEDEEEIAYNFNTKDIEKIKG